MFSFLAKDIPYVSNSPGRCQGYVCTHENHGSDTNILS